MCTRRRQIVIGGYTVGGRTFDALVFGHYDGQQLIYVARTRNGFTPSSRETLFRKFKGLEIAQCPFANLPEARSGRWGEGLTAEKMQDCVWLRPLLVARFEFLEWTPDSHLRHAKFVALRDESRRPDFFSSGAQKDNPPAAGTNPRVANKQPAAVKPSGS